VSEGCEEEAQPDRLIDERKGGQPFGLCSLEPDAGAIFMSGRPQSTDTLSQNCLGNQQGRAATTLGHHPFAS
jgi:hypothetical protein